jgi:microtubule-associated protein-like 6
VTAKDVIASLKDAKVWNTYTGILGDDLNGIWAPYSDKTDINTLDVTKKRDALVTGDDFGFVKLFKYPCSEKGVRKCNSNVLYSQTSLKAEFKSYKGHSAHVTNVRFTFDESYVVSVGGGDRSIFVWKVQQL